MLVRLVRRPPLALPSLLSALALSALTGPAAAAPVTVPSAVANSLQGSGQGLCVASAVSMTPATDFPQQADVYNSGINGFMEAHKAERVTYVQRTIFDLSNNQDTGPKISWGDFTNSMLPQCQQGGCGLNWNDTTTSFASRFRGFINVTGNFVNAPIHVGFYADDAVSFTVFDKSGNAYAVMTQPPVLGAPTWRLTETLTFVEPGIYPIEILYVQIVEHAALEMSFFTGTFADFQLPANQVPITSLATAGFTLFPVTSFFQTVDGQPSYPSLDQCKQCDRQFVGQFGNNGCDGGYYCNEAALCAPCNSGAYCGPSCSPCGGQTPFCINTNGDLACGECLTSTDCKAGYTCDTATHVCIPPVQCNVDADCGRGHECRAHVCQWCSEADKCAGSSCNCCATGANGKPMTCAVLPGDQGEDGGVGDGGAGSGSPPECVECLSDADCTGSDGAVCDVLIGQCVTALAQNERTSCCGPDCLQCPSDAPLCLPGPFGTACAACQQDLECPDGNYCIEGGCSPCTVDRRCGTRCETCGGDTPFCLPTQLVKDALCVRCVTDDECVGGTCDQTTHACTPTCNMSCAPATPFCDGTACVACYANTQCPCGGTCDLTSHTCTTSCQTNGDCLGDQHCQHADDGTDDKSCAPGPLPDNADCGGTLADLCSGSSIGSRGADPTPASGVLALSLGALLMRRVRRGRRRARRGGAS